MEFIKQRGLYQTKQQKYTRS